MEGPVHELAPLTLDKAERFVVLVLDEISLIVAQQETRALEPVLDVVPLTAKNEATPHGNAAGTLSIAGTLCYVYALDGELTCLPSIPAPHRICVIMNYRDEQYALSCKEVRLVHRSALTLREIPRPLLSKKSATPIKSLLISEGQLLLGTTAAALFNHVSRSREAEVIPFDERLRRVRT